MTFNKYEGKFEDLLHKVVSGAKGGKDYKYEYGVVYLPASWKNRKVTILLEE